MKQPNNTGAKREIGEATRARRDLLTADVLDKAAGLFLTRGFAATSLKDVADAVGLSRSSIYHYYPSKEALLAELIEGATSPVGAIFRDVEREKRSPIEAVREVVRRLVLWVADPRTHFRLMDRSEAELPEEILRNHTEAKRRVLSGMVKLIEAAMASGETRSLNPRVAALSIIGMTMWTAWWVQPAHGPTLESVAQSIADNAVSMLSQSDEIVDRSVQGLSRQIRESLDLIEAMATGVAARQNAGSDDSLESDNGVDAGRRRR